MVQVVKNQTAGFSTHRLNMKYRFDTEVFPEFIFEIWLNLQVPNRECRFGSNCQKPRCRFDHPPPPPPTNPDNVREVYIFAIIFSSVDAFLSVQILQPTWRVQNPKVPLLPPRPWSIGQSKTSDTKSFPGLQKGENFRRRVQGGPPAPRQAHTFHTWRERFDIKGDQIKMQCFHTCNTCGCPRWRRQTRSDLEGGRRQHKSSERRDWHSAKVRRDWLREF